MKERTMQQKNIIKMYDTLEPENILTDQGLMSITEFAQAEGFQWTESPMGTADLKEFIHQNKEKIEEIQLKSLLKQTFLEQRWPIENNASLDSMLIKIGISREQLTELTRRKYQQLEGFLQNPNKNTFFKICKINDIVGKGVFLVEDVKIKKGAIVSIYTGEYESISSQEQFQTYQLDLPEHLIFANSSTLSPIKGYINGEKYGNISRYFNNLPTSDKIFQDISNIFQDATYKEFYIKELRCIRQPIIKMMNRYNSDKKEIMEKGDESQFSNEKTGMKI